MWRTFQREGHQVGECEFGASTLECAPARLTTKDGQHLKVNEVRRGKALTPESCARRVSVNAVIREGHGEDAGINDEHAHPEASLPQP